MYGYGRVNVSSNNLTKKGIQQQPEKSNATKNTTTPNTQRVSGSPRSPRALPKPPPSVSKGSGSAKAPKMTVADRISAFNTMAASSPNSPLIGRASMNYFARSSMMEGTPKISVNDGNGEDSTGRDSTARPLRSLSAPQPLFMEQQNPPAKPPIPPRPLNSLKSVASFPTHKSSDATPTSQKAPPKEPRPLPQPPQRTNSTQLTTQPSLIPATSATSITKPLPPQPVYVVGSPPLNHPKLASSPTLSHQRSEHASLSEPLYDLSVTCPPPAQKDQKWSVPQLNKFATMKAFTKYDTRPAPATARNSSGADVGPAISLSPSSDNKASFHEADPHLRRRMVRSKSFNSPPAFVFLEDPPPDTAATTDNIPNTEKKRSVKLLPDLPPPPVPSRAGRVVGAKSADLTTPAAADKKKGRLYDTVQILGTEIKQDFKRNKAYMAYVIQAVLGTNSWTVYRRFREFSTLHNALIKKYGADIKLVHKMPPKKILGTSLKTNLVTDRRPLLEAYLKQFSYIDVLCNCLELEEFIKDKYAEVLDISLDHVLSEGVDYSLKLLSSSFAGEVRNYAVQRLGMQSDEDLMCYLLQLVQALRYETSTNSKLSQLLITRAVQNPVFGNYLYWHLNVEKEDRKVAVFTRVNEQFKAEMLKSDGGLHLLGMFMAQTELINSLSSTAALLSSMGRPREEKIKELRRMLGTGGNLHHLTEFPSLRLPIDPRLEIIGIVPTTVYLYKSALSPMYIELNILPSTVSEKPTYGLIFKKGDDLRQDQLITQMIAVMDHLWKSSDLDLRLTPYRVLATSSNEGFVQHIPSVTFAKALEESEFDMQRYFIGKHPDNNGAYGFSDQVLDNFVRSCAGYCVITFILGIGDRHLDNVLLTPQGELFHIDFGYILDANPPMKFAPPMKLSKEMIDVMGGASSPHYQFFIELSCTAYNQLRHYAGLIINMFTLMADAGISGIQSTDAIPKLQKKFRLDLDDGEASIFLRSMITESVKAVLPQMVETIHRWAQNRRS